MEFVSEQTYAVIKERLGELRVRDLEEGDWVEVGRCSGAGWDRDLVELEDVAVIIRIRERLDTLGSPFCHIRKDESIVSGARPRLLATVTTRAICNLPKVHVEVEGVLD